MSKRIFTTGGSTMVWTPTNHGSAATTLCFMALKGANATQVVDILEVQISGFAASSNVMAFMLAYASTLETTPTTLAAPGSDGPMMITATALASTVLPFIAASTGPTPSSSATMPKANMGLNSFGGILRWNAAQEQQWTQVGNAINGGESVLWNSLTHGGVAGSANAHIIYEPY